MFAPRSRAALMFHARREPATLDHERRGSGVVWAAFLAVFALVSHSLAAPPAFADTVEKRVAASSDDAEASASGSMYLNSSDLELVFDTSNQTVGMRWTGLLIPPGATITAAWIQFTAEEARSETTSVLIQGQAADNAATFASTSGNLNATARPRTAAGVPWIPPAWAQGGDAGAAQRTPDLTAIVREIVGRPGWANGNALVLIVTGTGRRNAYSFDGNAPQAPLLHVEFNRAPAPTAAVSVTQLPTPALTVRADGSGSQPGSGGTIASYRFDWGDGTAATTTTAPTTTAQHSYAAAGTYTVTLTVTDAGGNVSPPATASIVVRTNTAPVARLTLSQLATPALTVRADGSTSTDTDHAPIASYRFTWGDGTAATTTTAPTAVAQHTYASAGTYTVTLVATDAGGLASAPATATITVQPDNPPTARLTVAQIPSPPLTVSADGSTSTDTGPTPIASYRFTWGDGTAATTTTAPTAVTQHTYASAGTYTVTLVATDTGGNASAPATATVTVNPPPSGTTTLEKRVAAGSDDAEASQSGSMSLTSSDLEMVLDGSNIQTVGMRWTALTIPQGSTITAAYVQFTADESHSEATSLTIAGQAADNAGTFTTTSGNLNATARPRTTATAAWSPSAWTAGQATFAQRTPDLSAVIQQIVSRPGWASGNALALIVTGSGRRIARAFEGGANTAPLLHVEYLPAGAPTAQLTVAQLASPPYTVGADGSASTPSAGRTIASYRFDWGDGTTPTVTTAPNAVAQHTYTTSGTYTVSLTVTDDTGRTSTPATRSITMAPEGPPTARLTVTQVLNPPLTARADGSTSTDPDLSPIASYRFDWGDGSTPTVTTAPTAVADHAYAAAGTYTITLIATDTAGRNSTPATASITIQVNHAPVARLTATQIPLPYQTARADASASTDTDYAPITSYQFTWGDGTAATVTTPPTAITQHTYASPGTYTVTLTATDAAGLVSSPVSANVVVIADVAPVARLTAAQLIQPDHTVRADGSASTDTDLTPIASYRFTWGDGTAATVTTAPTAVTQHTYSGPGTYTVTLVATDTGGKTSVPATATVVVVPDGPPTAVLSAVQLPSPDRTVGADASGSTDLDLTPIASYRFDWGDGSTPTVTTPPIATAQHTYAVSGNFPVTLTVTDNVGQASTVAVTVPVLGRVTAERRVAASTDDAEQRSNGSITLTGGDLEMVVDGSNQQTVGMRWTNIQIPRNTTILSAWLQFRAASSNSGTSSLTIAGQAADNAGAFTTSTNNVSSRPRTSATVAWTPAAWSSGQAGTAQRTPDLAPILQQIVNRSGWNAGNALAMIVTGSGTRNANSYDGSTGTAPLLHIEFLGVGTPPTARLSLLQLGSPPLTVRGDGSTSTPGDNPIGSYRFEWGDGTAPTTVSAPTNTANHTYAAAGTYSVTLTAYDTGGRPSAPVTQSITVNTSTSGPISVYAGYYSTHHPDNPRPKPSPWWGSPGVVFAGTPDSPSGGWDTSAIRIDNNTAGPVTVTVTVDVGSNRFNLWGARTIPFEQTLILAQTGFENFDGSDLNPAGCYDCNPNDCLTKVQSTIPVVNITMGGTTTRYYDTDQVINTDGVDAAGCPYTGGRNDESRTWQQIFPQAPQASRAAETAEAGLEIDAAPARKLWLSPPSPNPAGFELVLSFAIPKHTEMKMQIFDISGRLIKTHMDGILEPGDYVSHISLRDVPAGVYYARMWTPERTLHQRFVHVQ